jgi:hypothetical protein
MANTGTIHVALKIDDKGSVKVIQNVGRESERTGKKGDQAFRKMDRSVTKMGGSAKMSAASIAKITAAVAALAAVGATAVRVTSDFANWERQMLRLDSQIKATGRTGEITAKQLEDMAQRIDKATLQSTAGARDAQAILMSFRNVPTESLERILMISADVAEVMGGDITSAARQMALALEDPERGLTALRRTGTTFTDEQKNLIISLKNAGREMEAQNEILKIMESQYGGAAKAAASGLAGSLDLLSRNSTNLKIAIGEGLSPAVKVYADRLADWIENNQELIAQNVARTVEDTFAAVEKIVELYDRIPDDIKGPGGIGIVGTMLFGPKIGALAGAGSFLFGEFRDFFEGIEAMRAGFMTQDQFFGDERAFEQRLAEYREYKKNLVQVYHAIDKNTEGYARYTGEAGKAGEATGNLTKQTEEQKRAFESLRDLQVQQALDVFFLDLDALQADLDAGLTAESIAAETAAQMWKEKHEAMYALKTRLAEVSYTEIEEAHQRHLERKAAEEERVYQEQLRRTEEMLNRMQGALADTFTDIRKNGIDDWKDLTDRMVDLWLRMLEEMAAAALMKNVFEPIMTGGGGGGWLSSALSFGASLFSGGGTGAVAGPQVIGLGGRAGGGPVESNKIYEVNERGPELLKMGTRQFLMMGQLPGFVEPVRPASEIPRPRIRTAADPEAAGRQAPSAGGSLTISVPVTVEGSKALGVELQRNIEAVVEDTIRRHS